MKSKTIVRVIKSGNRYNAFDANNNKWTSKIIHSTRKNAYLNGQAIELRDNGK